MELLAKLFGFFQQTDGLSKGMLLWGAFMGVIFSVRAFLVILAPMTETKFDDKLLGGVTKFYDFLSKLISHTNPKEK